MEVVLLFLALFVTVVAGMRAYDFLVRNRPALPRRFIGELPPAQQMLNEAGERQFRSAIVLLTQVAETPNLMPATQEAVEKFIEEVQQKGANKGSLLNEAGLILIRIQSEDGIMPQISKDLRAKLSAWLDEYLKRR